MRSQEAIVAVCTLLVGSASLRAEPSGLQQPDFDSNGVKIHYVLQGKADGEPVVLIHGFTADHERQWAPVVKKLSDDYRIIGLDCRGHGGSAKPHDPKQYGLEMVEDVVRLLDHLKIQRAHLVGYSMGAGIALQVVARHPDRVRSVVLGGNGMASPDSAKFYVQLAESLEQGKGFGPLVEALTPKDQPRPSEEQLRAINAFILAHNDALALAAVIRGMTSKDMDLSDDAIKGIKTPMCALIGERDPLKTRVDALKQRLPDVKVIVIPTADHVTAFSRDEFVGGVKEFLDRQRGTK